MKTSIPFVAFAFALSGCAGQTYIQSSQSINEKNKESFAIVEWQKGNFSRAEVDMLAIDGQKASQFGRAALAPGDHSFEYRCKVGMGDFSPAKQFQITVAAHTITALTAVENQGNCFVTQKTCSKGERLYFVNLGELVCESERPENLEFAVYGEHFLL